MEERNGLVAFGPARRRRRLRPQSGRARRRLPEHAVLCPHQRILQEWRRPAVERRSRRARTAPGDRRRRALLHRRRERSQSPDGSPRRAGLRRPAHRHRRLAGRPLADGLAGLRFARGHHRDRVRGEEPGRHRGWAGGPAERPRGRVRREIARRPARADRRRYPQRFRRRRWAASSRSRWMAPRSPCLPGSW